MRRCAAILLALALLAALPLCARADGQKLLYPGTAVEGSQLTVMTIPLSSGTVDVSVGDVTIGGGDGGTRAEANLGLTFYCVVDNSRSFSNYQRDQQRLGLIALSDALGPKDSMVLITMGREVSFGEKLTDPAQRKEAIEAACVYDAIGTNLYEAIDTVISTVAAQETGFSCIFIFTDGIDESPIVKINEDQAAHIVQGSGMSVNFVALLTPPITNYASANAQRLERYATLSLGGACRTPLAEGDGSVATVEQAVRDMVNATSEWRVLRLNTDDIPRADKTVELTLTWQGEGRTVTDTLTLDTTALPPLPEPVTEPPTLPPTEPPETIPPITQPAETIPEYLDEHADDMRYYAMIGFSVIGVLIVLAIVIVAADKHKAGPAEPRKNIPKKEKAPAEKQAPAAPQPEKADAGQTAPAQPAQLPPLPDIPDMKEAPAQEQPEPEPPEKPEVPETPEKQTEETPEPVREEKNTPPEEPKAAQPIPAPAEKDEAPAQPETAPEKQPEEAPPAVSEPQSDQADAELTAFLQGQIDLNQFLHLSGETSQQEEAPAPKPEQPAPKPQSPAPGRQHRRKPSAPPAAATEEWDLTEEPGEAQAAEKTSGSARGIFGRREPKPEKQRDSLHQSVSALRAAQRRSAQEEMLQAAQQPAAPAPGRPGSCTVRLTPEGNPAGTVYVTMEPGSSRTLGRNSKADVILNPRDTSLSGLHFELQWDGHILYLTDCGSTNGTSLTGIPQRPGHWSKVEPGTTLQAGSIRYKVKITKN